MARVLGKRMMWHWTKRVRTKRVRMLRPVQGRDQLQQEPRTLYKLHWASLQAYREVHPADKFKKKMALGRQRQSRQWMSKPLHECCLMERMPRRQPKNLHRPKGPRHSLHRPVRAAPVSTQPLFHTNRYSSPSHPFLLKVLGRRRSWMKKMLTMNEGN
jgi:hypothetical protein